MSIMKYALVFIFAIALIVRFVYFPDNIYFSFDQARDSFFALNILKGDIRLIGPPSAAGTSLFAGPLSLYLYSSVYLFFGENPEVLSAFFRIYNALGVFIVFLIASKLFGNKKAGLLSSLIYAVSYEQSQYSLFMSHQSLAVIPVLFLYLGLTILLFDKKNYGLLIALAGWGLAIQFHYVYLGLGPSILVIAFLLRKLFPKITIKNVVFSLGVFILTLSTYIIAEIKFGSRFISGLSAATSHSIVYPSEGLFAATRLIHDLFIANYGLSIVVLLLLVLILVYFLANPKLKSRGLFLLLWFLGGLTPYIISGTSSYYYSAGASVSLIILVSFLISKITTKYPFIGGALLLAILITNLRLIKDTNASGPNSDFVIQPGMLLQEEKRVLDYVYQNTSGDMFAIRALTIPLTINTTWSYLFEWYGETNYGFVPVWSEKPAEGFPGNLPYASDRSKLPDVQFVIIEPPIGIKEVDKDKFFQEENYFTQVIEEKNFGTITVQKRSKI